MVPIIVGASIALLGLIICLVVHRRGRRKKKEELPVANPVLEMEQQSPRTEHVIVPPPRKYVAIVPAISGISRSTGMPKCIVEIAGNNLLHGMMKPEDVRPENVRVAGICVKKILGLPTNEKIRVVVGIGRPGASGPVKLELNKSFEGPDGSPTRVLTSDAFFSYANEFEKCKVKKITPSTGHPGDEVCIKGMGLKGGYDNDITKVLLAGIAVKRIVGSPTNTSITVIVGDGPPGTSGSITIESEEGGKHETGPDGASFTYTTSVYENTTITSVEPSQGKGGDHITIHGSGLCGGYREGGVVEVILAGVATRRFDGKPTESKITVLAESAPPGTAGIVTLKSKWHDVFDSKFSFAYLEAFHGTEISKISPNVGEPGTEVSIFGSCLLGGDPSGIALVHLAGIRVTRIVGIPHDDHITVIAGPAEDGTAGFVSLESGSGKTFSSTDSATFRYACSDAKEHVHANSEEDEEDVTSDENDEEDDNSPAVDDVNPRFGAPGDEVCITGTNLNMLGSLTEVYLAGIRAKVIRQPDEQQSGIKSIIVVVAGNAPPGTAGVVKLESDTAGIASFQTKTIKFTYWEAFMNTAISSIFPQRGSEGTEVTIKGVNLHGGDLNGISNVFLNGVPVSEIVGNPTDSEIRVVVGNGTSKHRVKGPVILQTAAGASFQAPDDIAFEYWEAFSGCQVNGVEPREGAHGDTVVISGANLAQTELSAVYLGGIKAEIVGEPTNTTITVIAGEAPPGNVGEVRFESVSGDAAEFEEHTFKYFEEFRNFSVTGITSFDGIACFDGNPGDTIVITGNHLDSADLEEVYLAGVRAEIVGEPSADKIVVVVGEAPIGTVGPVSFESMYGSTLELDDFFWMYKTLEITSFQPSEGLSLTPITITGEKLLQAGEHGIASVSVAGILASIDMETATDQHIVVVPGTCTINPESLLGPSGHIVITTNSGLTFESGNDFTYSAKVVEGKRGELGNEMEAASGTFVLKKQLRRTSVSLSDGVNLKEGTLKRTGSVLLRSEKLEVDVTPTLLRYAESHEEPGFTYHSGAAELEESSL